MAEIDDAELTALRQRLTLAESEEDILAEVKEHGVTLREAGEHD